MTNVYDKHDSAFNCISSYVLVQVTKDGTISRLATVSFKRGKTSGNVRCFFHFIGYTMQIGSAGGGGYDKMSAAFLSACEKHRAAMVTSVKEHRSYENDLLLSDILLACAEEGNRGSSWDNVLRDKGFQLLQAI